MIDHQEAALTAAGNLGSENMTVKVTRLARIALSDVGPAFEYGQPIHRRNKGLPSEFGFLTGSRRHFRMSDEI